MDKPRNFVIMGAELNWVRLDAPVSSTGVSNGRSFTTPLAWELQVATKDSAKADEWKANHLNVKSKDGVFSVSLNRKAAKKDGSAMDPVRVVDAQKMPFTNVRSIGNGTTGNVIVWQAPYGEGNMSVFNSLTAVQITDLVEYTGGGTDFDVIDAPTETPSADLF